MTSGPKESDFVKTAASGELFTDKPRMVQTAEGTWLASWYGVPNNTPPIEKRDWFCAACFKNHSDFWREVPPPDFIDWKEVQKKFGQETSDRIYDTIKNHRISCWERIKNVEELCLKADVHCKHCRENLNSAAEALVEVY